MRRALLSVAVALAGGGALAGAAWSVQAAGLPPPSRAGRVAADATRLLSEHRVIVDIFHLDHQRLRGICVGGWFPLPDGKKAPGSLLALQSGTQYLIAGGKVHADLGLRRRARLPRLAFEVGCGRNITRALLPAEQGGVHLRAERAYAAGRPAIALRLHSAHDGGFSLYVAAGTYQPLVAIVHRWGETMTARLYLAHFTPALLSRFGVDSSQTRRRP